MGKFYYINASQNRQKQSLDYYSLYKNVWSDITFTIS